MTQAQLDNVIETKIKKAMKPKPMPAETDKLKSKCIDETMNSCVESRTN